MYSFEEIMKFHNDNINVYNEIKRNLPVLVPFVGAGLSRFAYYSWLDLLTELTKNITNKDDVRIIRNFIKQGGKGYLEAAQRLEDLRTPNNLARDIANLFSPKKLNDKKDQLTQEAIWLLPLLFSGLAITTNFDQTMEIVYENNYHLCKIFEHNQLGLLNQYLNQVSDFPSIFKLHGTVSGDYIEYDRIVFTENQYKKFYGDGSILTESLKKCLEQKTILFLGCSLSQDCTMDILESVLEEGKYYYTIINCKKTERDQKIKELGGKHIRAIVYEGDRHEAVRVILEHLLEETNPDAYRALNYHAGALISIGSDNRFTYDSDIIPFVGREIEMSELNAFLDNSKTAFKWWAITGPSGCGKSRLAYEFKKQLPNDWKSRYLSFEDYENLFSLADKLTDKTLLIADYVQGHAKEIGKFMAKLNNDFRSLPLRVLLVERETNDESGVASWITQLYSCVYNEARLKKACYKEFLNLQPLSDDNLKKIIKSYAMAMKPAYNKSITMSDENVDMLLQKLKTIDPNLYRPLYALFLTDAYIEGNDPERWNREDILDYIIGRENKRLSFNIGQIIGTEDSKLFSACKYILCIATVFQTISLDNLKKLCPEKWDVVEKRADRFESPEELLAKIGLIIKDEIPSLRPDLIGEYYVLDWIFKQNRDITHNFINTVWKKPLFTAVFFDQILYDYDYLLNEKQEYWGLIIPENLNNVELYEDCVISCYIFWVNLTNRCNFAEQCRKFALVLEECPISNPFITLMYAMGLFNLSNNRDEKEAEVAVNKLEKLFLSHSSNLNVAIILAKSLVNGIYMQESKLSIEKINRLEDLSYRFPNVKEMTVLYAKGLVNLTDKQGEMSAKKAVHCLEKLSFEHPYITEIKVEFAKGLINLISKQEEDSAEETFAKLKQLYLQHPDVIEIKNIFANGLFNMSVNQKLPSAQKYIDRLEKLQTNNPDVVEIAFWLARGLVNLVNKLEKNSAMKTVNKLEKLYIEYSYVENIVVLYAQGLVNLERHQNEHSALKTVERIQELSFKYSNITEIIVAFARGLVHLSHKQKEQTARKTIEKLERLSSKYSDVEEITVELAKGLVILASKQEEQYAIKTVEKLERLCSLHSNIKDVIIIYAITLISLSFTQNKDIVTQTREKLMKVINEYPYLKDIIPSEPPVGI